MHRNRRGHNLFRAIDLGRLMFRKVGMLWISSVILDRKMVGRLHDLSYSVASGTCSIVPDQAMVNLVVFVRVDF